MFSVEFFISTNTFVLQTFNYIAKKKRFTANRIFDSTRLREHRPMIKHNPFEPVEPENEIDVYTP